LGESILLGRESLERLPIPGLYTDAFTLFAEVMESIEKPSKPWGNICQNVFAEPVCQVGREQNVQTILALGRQDIDPAGIIPQAGIDIIGTASDHLIVSNTDSLIPIGSELTFQLNYSALMRAMASVYVAKVFKGHKEL
jgi:predicted amino acid racemase